MPPSPATISAPLARQITEEREGQLFRRMRRQYVRMLVIHACTQSSVRTTLLILLTTVLWGGVYFMFHEAFELLDVALADRALQARTVQIAFSLFFLSLTVMITLSAGVIFYAAVYRSPEIRYLLTTPTRPGRIVLDKFYETLFVSCWGFLLLGSPMLIAYGRIVHAPWSFFALLFPFVICFVCLPSGLGVILCLMIVYALPRVRLFLVVTTTVLLVVALIQIARILWQTHTPDTFSPVWFQQILSQFGFAEQRILPSWWLSMGLLEIAHPATSSYREVSSWREGIGYFNALFANALLIPFVIRWIGSRTLRPGFANLSTMGRMRLPFSMDWIDHLGMLLVSPLSARMRVLLLKDLRTFRRDPMHWSQFVIFSGLLAMYFFTIPRFDYGAGFRTWMAMVGFLNLGAIGLILSTFTTRFIFPMISMEGQRFWILGTLPMKRDAILWSKFLFAVLVAWPPCACLTILSDVMLGVVRHFAMIAFVHQFTCLVLCLGLAALSVGIGARIPNLRESSPAGITAAFGGTLTLILSAIYVCVTVATTAIPAYFYLRASESGDLGSGWEGYAGHPLALGLGMVATLLIGLIVTWIPLRSGIVAFRQLEF